MTRPEHAVRVPVTPLREHERNLTDLMARMGATTVERARSAEEIGQRGRLAKGKLMTLLSDLERQGRVEHVNRGKTAGYYLVPAGRT